MTGITNPEGRETCKHLMAPLVFDQAECDRLDVPNFRKCSRCGQFLWEDGTECSYPRAEQDPNPPTPEAL